jgi:hypothetical protein
VGDSASCPAAESEARSARSLGDVSETPDAAARAGIDPDARQAAIDAAHIARAEREVLERRRAAIEAGRRKGGVAGAAMAGAMMVMAEIVEGPKKDDAPVVVQANSDPTDVDTDGITVELGDQAVETRSPRRTGASPPSSDVTNGV